MTSGDAEPSPVPAEACAAGRSLADPLLSPDGAFVALVARGAEGARLVVVRSGGGGGGGGGDGGEVVVAADPAPAGRGGVVAWLSGSRRLAYLTSDAVAVVDPAGGPVMLLAEGIEGGAGGLAVAHAAGGGERLAFVADTRAVTVVAAGGGGRRQTVSADADFALDPSWSPDGERLAWHEWDVPDMPWDASRIVVAPAVAGGGDDRVVVAGGPGVSVQEPRFSPDGSALAFLSDATGWSNLWVAAGGGASARPLVVDGREHGGPAWGPGARSFAWSPDSRSIAFCRNEAGFGTLCVVDVATGEVRELSRGVHTSLSWSGKAPAAIACLRSGARTPTSVVALDPASGSARALVTGPGPDVAAATKALPEPDVVSWGSGDGAVVHGRLWRPPTHRAGSPPPLLVWAHGGPTDQRRAASDPRLVFFLTRGWAVLHADCRGSTGWGRSWAQALRGRWGEADVDDVAAGARAAAERGWGDPSRLVAMGASAGGMTALLLLAGDPALWAAGVALYPVTDLEDLAASTHRYEAHYPVGLLGPVPEQVQRYRRRSPLSVAGRIAAPVLLLHGSADVVVPAAQSREMAARLRAAGVAVEHHEYEGEGHGWGATATVEDELLRIESFLARHVAGDERSPGRRRDDRIGR